MQAEDLPHHSSDDLDLDIQDQLFRDQQDLEEEMALLEELIPES